MSFSEKQEKAIDEHFEKFAVNGCPVCSESNWSRHPDLGAICAQHGSGVNVYKTLQLVSRVCGTCGYVLSFDADKIGVGLDIKLKTNK